MDFERAIEEWVEDRRNEIIGFARDLISTPSVNPPGDETRVLSVIKERFEKHGMTHHRTVAKDAKRPNLITEVGFPKRGPVLLYNAHMDTKPSGELSQWKTDPFDPVLKDGYLHGLGSVDMKSAIAAMLYAACAVQEFAKELSGKLLLVFVADEEAGGEYGAKYLAREGNVSADIALIGEPTGITKDWESLYLVSRGETCFVVTVYGTQMHSSISDILPSTNANLLAARIMARMQDGLKVNYAPHPFCPKGITTTVGILMRGGVFYGVLPGQAEFSVEIRVVPGMSKEAVASDINTFFDSLRKEDPGLRVEWRFEKTPLDWIDPVEVDPGHPFVKVLEDAAKKVLPELPPRGAFPAWTDARFFKDIAGIPSIPSFGPGLLTQAHRPNENISIQSIIEATRIYALAAFNYLKAEP